MRLFHKIFLCFIVIFGFAFQAAGFLLLNFAYNNSIEQEKRYAAQQFQYNRYILRSMMYTDQNYIENIQSSNMDSDFTAPVALYDVEKKCLYSNMSKQPDAKEYKITEDNRIMFQIKNWGDSTKIYVRDLVSANSDAVYFVTETDISQIVDKQRAMMNYFQKIYLVIIGIGIPAIFILSDMLTSSIKKVNKAATRIAGGNFSERVDVKSTDEIGELAANFNIMADKIEETIEELSDAARQKEEFAANFAHELKTPMTSVIGYADMLYQRELPRSEVRDAAYYIWNEGMRLEALSLKLMDLFVLDKQEFTLEYIDGIELFDNLRGTLDDICKRNDVRLTYDIKPGLVHVEYDLFKTVMINLVDNAVKADAAAVNVSSSLDGGRYSVKVEDNGKGIPPEEIEHITEAFYMVDKSRSRKQHGAGIGMALVARIVAIHGGSLKVESDGKSGTKVIITLIGEAVDEDEDE